MKELRESKGLTQEHMAGLLGIKQSSYSLKESGKRKFKISELLVIKEILNVSLDEIINIGGKTNAS